MRQVDAVVLDYGGVVTVPVRQSVDAWLRADGVERSSYARALKAWLPDDPDDAPDGTPVHQLETGELPPAQFETRLAAELATVDGRVLRPAGMLARMFAGMVPDPAMLALVGELRDAGLRVALLSNSWGNSYPRDLIDELFDPVVISGEVGLRKPGAAIFRLVLDRLGLAADRVVFVDDSESNVAGARAMGMRAFRHADAAATRAELAGMVPALRDDVGADL